MNSKFSMVKSVLVAAALAASVSGLAHADSSMNPLTGDSYAYFNGCNLGQACKLVIDKAPSTFRASNPSGPSVRQLQAMSSEADAYALKAPVIDKTPSTFARSNPHGLSERQLQALSSEAPAWQLPKQTATSALASTNAAAFSMNAGK